jgi:hypothetical protein
MCCAQQEEKTMNKRCAMAACVAWVLAANVKAAETRSEPVRVNTLPTHNRCWSSVFTNEVQLTWSQPTNAINALLKIEGMNSELTTNLSASETGFLWRPFASGMSAPEDVYALTLTFLGDAGSVIGAMTSRLAVVKGAFGAAEMDPVPASGAWGRVGQNVVIPYDAAWTNVSAGAGAAWLTVSNGGVLRTNALADTCGYVGWKVKRDGWGYGTFALSLSFSGAAGLWNAELMRPMDGTAVSVR